MSADIDKERAEFEAWAMKEFRSLEKAIQYADQPAVERPYNMVRTAGAWEGWQAARATPSPAPIPEGQAERLLGEKLRCEFTSGTVTRDFGGPKITLRYKTQAATERAFAAVADLLYATPPAAPKEPT